MLDHYDSKLMGRAKAVLTVQKLPMTVNHMYIHTRWGTRLDPRVTVFRDLVKQAIESQGFSFKPKGKVAAVILMASPTWVTLKRMIRRMDVDNRVKPILDAIEKATGFEDERVWQVHCYKLYSKRESITVHLFDTGDIVEYFG